MHKRERKLLANNVKESLVSFAFVPLTLKLEDVFRVNFDTRIIRQKRKYT